MGTTLENKKVLETFAQKVFNNHELEGLEELVREDYIQHNADCTQGLKGFIEFFEVIFKAVPDFRYDIQQIVADGDLVWMWSKTVGTHTGGSWLDVQPSGRKLEYDVIDMFRIQDGKIAEHWDVCDTYTFFSQLGRFAS